MNILFFDTETTGLPLWKEPSDHPDQPRIHGITTEIAREQGVEPQVALAKFLAMVRRADLIVGHNVSFDIRMVRMMSAQIDGQKWDNPLPIYCTMRKSTNHCRILSNKPRHPEDWKWPKLSEAIKALFGEDFPDAHRARPDCDASRRIYFYLKDMEIYA